ncbi:MAG: HEPN domain-containing protein [Thermodesulfovibrionales bacterium]
MTLEPSDKISLSDIRMARAYEFLEDAEMIFKAGRYKTSVNRSYYAVLNAIRAVLILEGVNPKSHEGAMPMLSLRLIKPGLLPKEFVKNFELLLSRRTDVDYGDLEITEPSDAEDSLNIAREMLSRIDKLRKEMIENLSD